MTGGTFANNSTVDGNQPAYPSTVTVSFSQGGKPVTSVPYGSTVTITATMERAETATNALSADAGTLDFYLGAVEGGTKLNQNEVPVTQGPDGTYTAALNVTLDGENWKPTRALIPSPPISAAMPPRAMKPATASPRPAAVHG